MEKSGDGFAVLVDFTLTSGHSPRSALIQLADGFLYGTTLNGDDTRGTVFKLDTDGNNFQIIHTIQQGEGKYLFAGLVLGADSLLYGTSNSTDFSTDGTVYRLNSEGGSFEACTRSHPPRDSSRGMRFSEPPMDRSSARAAPRATAETVRSSGSTPPRVASRSSTRSSVRTPSTPWRVSSRDPADPVGTTTAGGPRGSGSVFKIDPAGSGYTILHGFGGDDGAGPAAALLVGSDGRSMARRRPAQDPEPETSFDSIPMA